MSLQRENGSQPTPDRDRNNEVEQYSSHPKPKVTYFVSHPRKDLKLYTNANEILLFFQLIDRNRVIYSFLQYDCCYRLADKYLIAMVFIYFKRAGLRYIDFTYLNFFAALSLAHMMEEEDEDLRTEIYPWALGQENLEKLVPQFLDLQLHLWQAMDLRAAVSEFCCQEVFSLWPDHQAWRRLRTPLHGGAPCDYVRAMTPPPNHEKYDALTNSCAKCRGTRVEGTEAPQAGGMRGFVDRLLYDQQ